MRPIPALVPFLALTVLAATPLRAQWSTTALSTARQEIVAVSVGGKSLFAGGRVMTTLLNVVDVYDHASGTWSSGPHLTVARAQGAGTAVGHLALFAGGSTSSTSSSARVDVYDAQTGLWSTASLSVPRFALAAATVGSKAIFAGGAAGGPFNPAPSNVVDIYDASIGLPGNPAAWSTATLSSARGQMAAASAGGRAIFAGGINLVTALADVDIYDGASGMWTTATLSQARLLVGGGIGVGTRAFFGGGGTAPGVVSDVVDVYDTLTGTWTTRSLSVPRYLLAATAVGDTVLFAGGDGIGSYSSVVDVLDAGNLTWAAPMQLSQARTDLCATTVGGRALFAGGRAAPGTIGLSSVVDVYEPLGLNYCAAAPNSTGYASTISATGSSSILANDLMLRAVDVPNAPFLFYYGTSRVESPFGNGYRCAGGTLVRLGPSGTATGGLATKQVDLPTAGITAPGVRNFQCWFRNPAAGGAGFNTSDAIEITFAP